MNGRAIIIGGGIGGLFTGAFLAKNGVRVTVLEKNGTIGGGLQCFKRGGKIFETGMHVLGGFEEGGTLLKICNYLGITDRLHIQHIPAECMDQVTFHSDGSTYRIASGREGFINSVTSRFPHEAEGVRRYVEAIYRITEEVPLFHLRESEPGLMMHSEEFTMAADALIAKYVSDPKLRELLAYLNPLYGGIAGHTPAYVHALINVLYINGASRFIGGSQQLADALRDVITASGGEVKAGAEVTRLDVSDKMVTAVHTAHGGVYTADHVISSIHPATLTALLPEGAFPRGFIKRLNEIPVSHSAFSLFIDLKPGVFPYIDHTCYFMEDYGEIWTQHLYDGPDWPLGFMYMTPPDDGGGEFASRLLVHCIMSYDRVSRWADTSVGKRGPEYEQWKAQRVAMVLAKLEKLFPGFSDMTAHVYAASPLTIRDYYHTKEGAIFGYRKDCNDLMFSQLPVYTKLRNLLLTGQNINLHGICGVPLTAITTAEAILGNNFLIKAINDANA